VQAHDPDLVLWLIGTHHGWGRPFFPPVLWPATDDASQIELCGEKLPIRAGWQVADAGTGWIDLFVVLKKRYGPWGLAHLEASLRLADHRRS
jgi:CRISPR-associated endonuclease/helicase Cas3